MCWAICDVIVGDSLFGEGETYNQKCINDVRFSSKSARQGVWFPWLSRCITNRGDLSYTLTVG